MSEKIYIEDDFGTQIPLLDAHGNLSLQVMMLFAEDKLSEKDRLAVTAYAASDEMSKDALEGFILTRNSAKTRHHLSGLNNAIQKASGAKAVSTSTRSKDTAFNYQKLAAALALLVLVGSGTFLFSKYFTGDELADNSAETVSTSLEEGITNPNTAASDSLTDTRQPRSSEDEQNLADENVGTKSLEVVEELVDVSPETETIAANRESSVPSQASDQLGKNNAQKDVASGTTKDVTNDRTDNKAVEKAKTTTGADLDKRAKETAAELDLKKRQLDEAKRIAAASVAEQEAKAKRPEEQAARAIMAAEMAESDNAGYAEEVASTNLQGNGRKQKADETVAQEIAETDARFPGGDMEMYRFIEKNKNYSDAMQDEDLKGAVVVIFTIEKDGKVSSPKINTGADAALNEDALRVVRSMPKWQPATKGNKPIKSTRKVLIKYGE